MKTSEYKSILKISSRITERIINLKNEFHLSEDDVKEILNEIVLEEAILTAAFIDEE